MPHRHAALKYACLYLPAQRLQVGIEETAYRRYDNSRTNEFSMRTRYFHDSRRRPGIKAVVYERSDHGIARTAIDLDARKICTRLKAQGHEAYIVGGAVRDLLLGRVPKDLDIATDAPPGRVKKLFRNSRIIGKRFRLVHVYFSDGRVHEVATFRAAESGDRNHVFGTLHEDVMRRDFSLNALYFDTEEETVIDFVGGVKDIRRGVIKSVLPLSSSFSEDPVRMLRAVKYAAITGMRIAHPVARRIRKEAHLLSEASVSRLSEELYKILSSRNSEAVFRFMDRHRLIAPMLPRFDACFRRPSSGGDSLKESVFLSLARLDEILITGTAERNVMLRHLTESLLISLGSFEEKDQTAPLFSQVVYDLKNLLSPLVQPNRDVEEAVRLMFINRGFKPPRRRPRNSRFGSGDRGSRSPSHRRRRRSAPKPADAE